MQTCVITQNVSWYFASLRQLSPTRRSVPKVVLLMLIICLVHKQLDIFSSVVFQVWDVLYAISGNVNIRSNVQKVTYI